MYKLGMDQIAVDLAWPHHLWKSVMCTDKVQFFSVLSTCSQLWFCDKWGASRSFWMCMNKKLSQRIIALPTYAHTYRMFNQIACVVVAPSIGR